MKSNPDNIKLWVEALRSDRFKQGRAWLGREEDTGTTYCCLGVACELAIKADVEVERVVLSMGHIRYDGQSSMLPTSVRKWLGVAHINPRLTEAKAAELNDCYGWTFDQIADAIEKTYLDTR